MQGVGAKYARVSSNSQSLGPTACDMRHAPLSITINRATTLAQQALNQSRPFHHANMQSLPDARSQSFEELYGPPENFLEIEVRTEAVVLHNARSLAHIVACTGPQPNDTW